MGVELSYVIDKGSQLLDVQRERAQDPQAGRRHPDGLFAVGVLLALYDAAFEGPVTVARVADVAGVPRHHTLAALEVLEDAGVVEMDSASQRWKPTHAASDITASEVLRAWQSLASPNWMGGCASGQLVAQMQLKLEYSANTSMADLRREV